MLNQRNLTLFLGSIIVYLFGMQIAIADNFNYASTNECRQALDNYYEKAWDLANKSTSSKDREGFMNMTLFFFRFEDSGSDSHTTCINGICTFESDANCTWAEHTDNAPWRPLITTLLTNEVNNFLNSGHYDPEMTHNTRFTITCTYPEKLQIDWNQCKMIRKN